MRVHVLGPRLAVQGKPSIGAGRQFRTLHRRRACGVGDVLVACSLLPACMRHCLPLACLCCEHGMPRGGTTRVPGPGAPPLHHYPPLTPSAGALVSCKVAGPGPKGIWVLEPLAPQEDEGAAAASSSSSSSSHTRAGVGRGRGRAAGGASSAAVPAAVAPGWRLLLLAQRTPQQMMEVGGAGVWGGCAAFDLVPQPCAGARTCACASREGGPRSTAGVGWGGRAASSGNSPYPTTRPVLWSWRPRFLLPAPLPLVLLLVPCCLPRRTRPRRSPSPTPPPTPPRPPGAHARAVLG